MTHKHVKWNIIVVFVFKIDILKLLQQKQVTSDLLFFGIELAVCQY